MEIHDDRLPAEEYLAFLEEMPQVCVEVVLERDGEVLLAERTNEPAAGEWFWPGSRLYKGEETAAAARRVGREELGVDLEVTELLGVRSHFWERSAQSDDVGRHTVNVVYHARPADEDEEVRLDDQHAALRWVDGPEPSFHEYVRSYFAGFDLPRDA